MDSCFLLCDKLEKATSRCHKNQHHLQQPKGPEWWFTIWAIITLLFTLGLVFFFYIKTNSILGYIELLV